MPNAHSDWRRYRRLLSFVRPWRTRLVAGMAMLASVSLLEPLIQIAFSQILDRAFVSSADNGAAATRSALARGFLGPVSEALQAIPILWFPVLLVALFAVRSAANFLGDFALHWVASRVVFDLRRHVFAHLLRLPSAFFDRNATAELTSKITYDAQQVGAVTSQALTTLVQDSLKLVAAIAMMASVSWRLTLGVFVIAPVVAVVVRAMTRRLRAASVALQTQMGELARFTDEALSNQRAVKIYAAFQRMGSSFTERADAVRRTIMRQETANAASAPLMHLVVSIAIAGIVALAIIEGQRQAMTAGDFFIFFTALLSLLPPTKSLSSVNAVLQRGLAAATSLFAVLDEADEALDTQPDAPAVHGAIAFEGVSLRYAGRDRDALTDVSLEIAAGQRVAFVGASGGGKSSALALIAGFYAPNRGVIRIDGVPVGEIGLAALRSDVALVSQDVLLISDSVAANVAFGVASEEIDRARVQWAAEAAGAAEFIAALPNAFDTPVGEGGGLLSGGQRQRVAIARALYKRAPILLFDEATSALDSESERAVQATIRSLGGTHTIVQVAHRLSAIRDVDEIFVFADGHLVERGSHRDLVNAGGTYAALVTAPVG
ncbi:MAG: ATP-binding cassette domain-containing protein [Burkholderiales bacterium]|nr:ATP-binding cassette domain-containing protein [Burkholderiales bacterium]